MKPRTLLTTAALFAAALFILDVPAAYATDYTWTGATDYDWNDQTNWTPNNAGYPDDNTDTATIADVSGASGNWAILNVSVTIGGLTVNTGGRLDIGATGADYTLTLDGNVSTSHTINGTINLLYDDPYCGTLAFTVNDQTLTGSGKIDGDNVACMITISDGEMLTLDTNCTIEGALTIDESAGSAIFINDGTLDADLSGTLAVSVSALEDTTPDPDVLSNGAWKVTASGATLQFNVSSTLLATGTFTVSNGTLDVKANVTTSGDLSFTGGTISVDGGVTFQAG